MSETKECFAITPIGKEDSEIRNHANNVFEHVIQEPLDECGYVPVRADYLDEPGDITRQVIERVYDSNLVIADLSYQNANVFYELAIRHAAQKPAIQIMQRGHELPFDIQNTRTIFYDLGDVPSTEKAKQQINDQIDHIETGTTPQNPVSETLEFKAMRESGDPERESLAIVREDLSDLESVVTSLVNELRGDTPRKKPGHVPVKEDHLEEIHADVNRLVTISQNFADILQQEEYQDDSRLQHLYPDLNAVLESLHDNVKLLPQTRLAEYYY